MRFDYRSRNTHFIREVQVVQEKLGEIVLRVVLEPGTAATALEHVRELVTQWTSPRLHVRFDIVPELERSASGRFKAVVSHLPAAARGLIGHGAA